MEQCGAAFSLISCKPIEINVRRMGEPFFSLQRLWCHSLPDVPEQAQEAAVQSTGKARATLGWAVFLAQSQVLRSFRSMLIVRENNTIRQRYIHAYVYNCKPHIAVYGAERVLHESAPLVLVNIAVAAHLLLVLCLDVHVLRRRQSRTWGGRACACFVHKQCLRIRRSQRIVS